MTHADDEGMVVPPMIAPYQIIFVPVIKKAQDEETVMSYINNIAKEIKTKTPFGEKIRVKIDKRNKQSVDKFWEWTKKGAPIICEIGMRDVESENIVRLMNLLFEKTLINWNPSASQNDTEQIKLSRMFSSKSIMAWSELFKDAISAKLEIYDTDEKSKVFYRQLEDSDFEKIDQIIIRLVNWQMWDSPKDSEIDKMISNNKSTLKQWLKDKGLSTGYLMGASE